jgi:hypothetical protein
VDFNELLKALKEKSKEIGIAYNAMQQEYYANLLLTSVEYLEFCNSLQKSPVQVALDTMEKSKKHYNTDSFFMICS